MQFQRTIGIDYSGAETADASLKGLRAYMTEAGGPTVEVLPPKGPKRYWTRRGLADWLAARLGDGVPTIAGIDHAFSFPDAYFARHDLPRDWDAFLGDFHAHWPTDQAGRNVESFRRDRDAMAARRDGDRRWRRRVEQICRAKSVFHFDVTGQVAKSTHAGLPFLRQMRKALPDLHIWPFDGWAAPERVSVLAEVYPRLWSGDYPNDARTADQQDAFAVASWLRDAGADGRLAAALSPGLGDDMKRLARHEGWILGILRDERLPKSAAPESSALKDRSNRGTTIPGYINRNGQVVIGPTGLPGTDHNQKVYHLRCSGCGLNYGANGSDIHQRRCPACGKGKPGLVI